jgi:hypothetical protein
MVYYLIRITLGAEMRTDPLMNLLSNIDKVVGSNETN